jgi:L-2-hydroxyglutarate oxidase LhgO
MGWFLKLRIKNTLATAELCRQVATEAERCGKMIDAKQKGTVKALEDLIKLAKRAKYKSADIQPVKIALNKYKLDTPKNLW